MISTIRAQEIAIRAIREHDFYQTSLPELYTFTLYGKCADWKAAEDELLNVLGGCKTRSLQALYDFLLAKRLKEGKR